MKNDFFTASVIPYLETSTEELDSADVKALKVRWAEFSQLNGIKRMMERDETTEALEIFEFATSL